MLNWGVSLIGAIGAYKPYLTYKPYKIECWIIRYFYKKLIHENIFIRFL